MDCRDSPDGSRGSMDCRESLDGSRGSLHCRDSPDGSRGSLDCRGTMIVVVLIAVIFCGLVATIVVALQP